jgi:hypothetical protein
MHPESDGRKQSSRMDPLNRFAAPIQTPLSEWFEAPSKCPMQPIPNFMLSGL